MATWKEDIITVINNLGGQAHLSEIYAEIEKLRKDNLTQSWKSVLRGTIERYSSDSEVYNGKVEDLFYTVEGKGNGIWGLRYFIPTKYTVDLTEDDISFPEGKEKLRIHIYKERNPRLVLEAKKKFIKQNSRLFCEICGFDFEKEYGEIGKDFIEAHHLEPISEIIEEKESKIDELLMVCSNCHKMIHRKRPWLSREEIKKLKICDK